MYMRLLVCSTVEVGVSPLLARGALGMKPMHGVTESAKAKENTRSRKPCVLVIKGRVAWTA